MDETRRDMFDTMTLTKAGGALCGALLVFLLGSWVADILFTEGKSHSDLEHAQTAYLLAPEEDFAEEEAEEVEVVPFPELVAAADVSKGEKAWKKCKACHKLEEGANGTGPSLYGVVGRQIASEAGFKYSTAMTDLADKSWTIEELNAWIENPKEFAPGNKMTYKGMKKEGDRAALIAYLQTIGS